MTPKRSPRCGLALGVLLLSTSCLREEPEQGAFRLEAVKPSNLNPVVLNEELSLTFTGLVDPTSVSEDSLSIVSEDGEVARGEWTVDGQLVRFRPSPVLARDLSDGGFRPATDYQIVVLGFPNLNGLRSLDGTPLDQCWRIGLRTAEVDDFALEDTLTPAKCGRTWLPQQEGLKGPIRVGSLESIWIYCEEPLDPRTLHGEEFSIEGKRVLEWRVELDPETGRTRRIEDRVEQRRIALRAALRENLPETSRNSLAARARVELQPEEALDPDWSYQLFVAPYPGPSLADFRGNRASRWNPYAPRVIEIEVVEQVRPRRGQISLQFLDGQGFLPRDLPWADGTAHWGDSGRLSVRFPAAAGDGRQGEVVLREDVSRLDVHATSLTVPAGERVRLPPGRGLHILRAQGRLTIDGTLERKETNGPEPPLEPFSGDETLSAWLEKTRRENRDWTVLVAGGDLTIRGTIEVDTPLLLVAGGWIRIAGRIVQPADQLWLMPDGGGTTYPTASRPELILDEPTRNPLVEPLRVAVVTSPMPSREAEYRWLGLEVGARAGAGSYRVRFLPKNSPLDPALAVDHPGLVEGSGQVQMLLELTVPPGDRWDPPSIDYVILDWDPQGEDG